MSTFGKRLRQLRTHRGYTQEHVAKQVKVNRTAVANWELSNTSITAKSLLRCAQLFSVNPYWLMFGELPVERRRV
jgi:transcriptional regulator with XRE-family HTH domain